MPETPRASQSFPYTNEENALGKKFFVFKAGNTSDAHRFFVKKLSRVGQIEVTSAEGCDYILVFCPVVSRVGTNIAEALDNMPSGKPAILVVMHHTFDCDRVPGESRRQVNNPNVRLTVDCLFYEGKFLDCNRNDIMWHDVQTFLRVPDKQMISFHTTFRENLQHCLKMTSLIFLILLLVAIIIFCITAMLCLEGKKYMCFFKNV
ncbi:uncharacterized protein LOC115774815 [Archocentrus centrarchus]|uniref:uncharacterized protein LOC115774815 n=1 Tax=Archocentrus centrarchus TaxID=63155 RepID=UPI0011E9C3B3|nr:uncharacterized protein LOC115774815 [Archocentrus centrarchus]